MTTETDLAGVSALRLAQALCARLCHDLGGPVGMVAAVLEMGLGGDPGGDPGGGRAAGAEAAGEAAQIALESAQAIRARLRLWRAACGGDTGPMPAAGLAELLGPVLAGGRVSLHAALPAETVLPPAAAQLGLVAAMLAVEALPRGGVVQLAGSADELQLLLDGPNARWPSALTAALAGRVEEPDPRTVLAPVLVNLAQAEGWRVSLAFGPGMLPGPLLISRR